MKFSGGISEWLTLWSAFETTIHNNNTLDLVDKLKYLRSFWTPVPLKSIDWFSATSDNYLKVIQILKGRYGNTDLLISVYMNRLINISPLKHIQMIPDPSEEFMMEFKHIFEI